MSFPYWPGDAGSIQYQQLTYDAGTQQIGLVPFGNTIQLVPDPNELISVPYPSSIIHVWENVSSSVVRQEFAQVMSGTTSNTTLAYSIDGDVKGALVFYSSIQGGLGGVSLGSDNGCELYVRNEGMTLQQNNQQMNFYIPDGTNSYIQQFPAPLTPGALASQIHFNSATSSIALVSGTGQSIGVGNYGIDLNPGTGSDVLLTSGVLNINNSALSNVSSINGAKVGTFLAPPTQWVNPIAGPYPNASTIANAGTLIPLAFFSTNTSNITRVSLQYQSADVASGGNPTDQAQMSLFSYQLIGPPGPFGPARWINTWRADQTDDPNGPYTFGTSVDFLSQDTQAGVYINNLTAAGNIQNVTLLSLTTQDMGAPNNVY